LSEERESSKPHDEGTEAFQALPMLQMNPAFSYYGDGIKAVQLTKEAQT
jgi:hypothetical protein